jgi:DNA sulfur modification protein DndD
MKLRRMTLYNFRQFLGSQTLEFATGTERNVTVVYAANGAGKTTLLNAFIWALFGKTTPDFEQPDRIVNDHVLAEADGEPRSARVSLHFEHEHAVYTLERTVEERIGPQGRRERAGTERVSLSLTDESGRNAEVRNPEDAIDRILPERLHQFFFFNGERIERLVGASAYEEIEQAIKTLLGLEVIERALKHLPQVRKTLEGELRKVGTPEIARITERIDTLEEQQTTAQDELGQLRRNIAACEEELNLLDEKLRGMAEARTLQDERQQKETRARETETHLRTLRERLEAVLNDKGFLAFTERLTASTQATFENLRTKGEIPAPMKRQFVDDLLESGRCICGASLVEGTAAHTHVLQWRQVVGLADVEEAWTRTNAQVGQFELDRADLAKELDQILVDLASARAERERLEEELSELSRKLEHFPAEEVRGLEIRRKQVDQNRIQFHESIGGVNTRLSSLAQQLADAKRELQKATTQSDQQRIAKRRVSVADEAAHILDEILHLRTQDVREELDERIRHVYASITYKPYEPHLDEYFRLSLRNPSDQLPVAKSTGENQILSLSFVGALAALARERFEASREDGSLLSLFSTSGGIFPIVMDAPFGTLDEIPRREIARALPALAPQIIIFVSKAQGLGPAEEELRERIGRSWVVHYFSPKEGMTPERIKLSSGEYPYIDSPTDGVERAELVEIYGS